MAAILVIYVICLKKLQTCKNQVKQTKHYNHNNPVDPGVEEYTTTMIWSLLKNFSGPSGLFFSLITIITTIPMLFYP